MSSKVWIDLTDMLEWSGNFGGTQRVVYGIARQYYDAAIKKELDVGFVAFDNHQKKFFETDFENLIKKKEESDQRSDATNTNLISKKEQIKHIVISRTPRFITNNPTTKKAVYGSAKRVYKLAKKVKNKTQQITSSTAPDQKVYTVFNQGDSLLLLGKPWDSPLMMPSIEKYKSERKILVFTVIYDLVITLQPHLHSAALYKAYTEYLFFAASLSDGILPISKSSERDFFKFCEMLNLPKPTSRVIRLGDDVSTLQVTPRPPRAVLDPTEPFLLCVGTIEVRKNHTLLYYLYKLAAERGIHLPKLIIVGRVGWHANDIYNLIKNDPAMAEKMYIFSTVNDSELEWLYQNCSMTLYPSMYEGWGLPVAESLQYGKIAIASNSSSIPEIADNLLEYFSPYSVDEFLHLVVKYLDVERKKETEEKIKSEYKTTSWQTTYKLCEALRRSLTD